MTFQWFILIFGNILESSELFCLFFVEGGKIDESSGKHEKTSDILKSN